MQKGVFGALLILTLILGAGIGYYIPVHKAEHEYVHHQMHLGGDNKGYRLVFDEGDYPAAIDEFKLYLKHEKGDYASHMGLGWAYQYNKDHKLAWEQFEIAQSIDDQDYGSHFGKCQVAYQVGNYEDGIAHCSESLKRGASYNSYLLFNTIGWSNYHLGRHNNAIIAFNVSLERAPDAYFPLVGLALSYHALGDELSAQYFATEVQNHFVYPALVTDPAYKKYENCFDGVYSPSNMRVCNEMLTSERKNVELITS